MKSIDWLSVCEILWKLPASQVSKWGIDLMACAAFKTCSAPGWWASAVLNVGAGKQVGAGHFHLE